MKICNVPERRQYNRQAAQQTGLRLGINIAVNIFPAVTFFAALVIWMFYPIDAKKAMEIRAELEKKA